MNAKPPREPLHWLLNNPLVALTILGLLLYATFAIPATSFYASLGTTPSEVGYSYATILSGSTLGALVIVLVFFIVLFQVVQFLIIFIAYTVLFRIAFGYVRHPSLLAADWELDTDQFERKLAIVKKPYGKDRATWSNLERMLRRRRALKKMESPSAAEESEMKTLGFKIPLQQGKYLISLLARALRPRAWYIYLLFPVLIFLTIIFTVIANNQANHVMNGTAESTGNEGGLFDYNVESVRIMPAQAGDKQSIDTLVGKKLYLLGQNAQYVILYVPQERSTVRVPTAAVIIISPSLG